MFFDPGCCEIPWIIFLSMKKKQSGLTPGLFHLVQPLKH